jgi:hypothetical protein
MKTSVQNVNKYTEGKQCSEGKNQICKCIEGKEVYRSNDVYRSKQV